MPVDISQTLQEAFGLSDLQLQRLITRSPHSYKIYTIPKKSGGMRTIAQPAKETKYLQHWLIANIFSMLPVHDCASAYKSGASIKLNADAHSKNQYLSKFDFRDFFPSIKYSDLIVHFERYLNGHLDPKSIKLAARLSCIRIKSDKSLCLSVGAPSSPVLSNSVMFDFDSQVYHWCLSRGITYTRYADDLSFSTNIANLSSEIQPWIQETLQNILYPKLTLHPEKTIHLSKKFQRRITGVIISNEGRLSIGRDRKRLISALIHRFSLSELQDQEIHNLQGLLGFAADIEPDFVLRMRKKYDSKLIDRIFSSRKS